MAGQSIETLSDEAVVLLAKTVVYPPVRDYLDIDFIPDLVEGLMQARWDRLHAPTREDRAQLVTSFATRSLTRSDRMGGQNQAAVAGYLAGLLGKSLEDIQREAR